MISLVNILVIQLRKHLMVRGSGLAGIPGDSECTTDAILTLVHEGLFIDWIGQCAIGARIAHRPGQPSDTQFGLWTF
jgi:hypothetical protein